MLADDISCYIDGSNESFEILFDVLNNFGKCSGCKVNMSKAKSNLDWVKTENGSQVFSFQDKGPFWVSEKFSYLRIKFLNLGWIARWSSNSWTWTNLNSWKARNFTVGKARNLLLENSVLLSLFCYHNCCTSFSVLCIKILESFFFTLTTYFLFHLEWW